MIRHTVLMNWKSNVTEASIDQVTEAFRHWLGSYQTAQFLITD